MQQYAECDAGHGGASGCQAARPDPGEKDSFQNQIKQAAGQSSETETKAEAAAPDQVQEDQVQENQVQEGQTVTVGDPKELERQMTLAALAVMQNPVVPVEQGDWRRRKRLWQRFPVWRCHGDSRDLGGDRP